MPPEVIRAGGKYLGSPSFPLYDLRPEPLIDQTRPGAWEMESLGISLEIQSSAGEEGLDGMDLMKINPGRYNPPFYYSAFMFTLPTIFNNFHLKPHSSATAFSLFPLMRGIADTIRHINLRPKTYR